jgi:hypothetical protein
MPAEKSNVKRELPAQGIYACTQQQKGIKTYKLKETYQSVSVDTHA